MCLGIFFFTKSFSINWKKWLSMSPIQVHLPSPQYSLWRTNKFVFFWSLSKWFTFANRCKNQFKILLEISIVQQVQTGNVHLHFWRKLSANHNEAYTNLCPKSQKKTLHFWHNRVDFLLVATVNQQVNCSLILWTFNLQTSKMTFSVSNNAIEFSPDFGPHWVTLTVKKNCPKNDNRFTRNLTGSLELVFFSETRLFKQ